MPRLIDKAKVASILQVAIGIIESEFEKYIDEAQELDLKNLMCEEFYYDLLKNKAEAKYVSLINGGEYQFEGKPYAHVGIGKVLAYFTYARFQLESPTVSTSHGMVQKTTPFSTPVPLEERRNVYYKKREDANTFMADVIKFIERNIDDYPEWDCNSRCGNKSSGSFSTRVLR